MTETLFPESKLTVYNSSAGSGKTYTLATEFIRFALLDEHNYRRILAITFTNKATAEMKERILSFLHRLAEEKDDQLSELMVSKTGLSPAQIKERSGRVLYRILHHYSFFSVNTIDSFFQRLIKSFAVELNIYIDYEVLLDTKQVVQWTVDEMLERSANDEKLNAWIQHYVQSKIDDDASVFNLKSLFEDVSAQVFSKVHQDKIEHNHQLMQHLEDAENIRKALHQIKQEFETKMDKFSQKGLAVYANHGLSPADFKYKFTGVGTVFHKISKTEKKYELGSRVMAAYHDPAAWVSKGSDLVGVVEQKLHPLLSEIVDTVEKEYTAYNSAIHMLKNIYAFGITQLIESLKEEYVRDNNVLLLSDSAAHISGLIKEEEDAPFLYDKIGTYFSYLLLDEAQDTSLSQWRNLLPLVKNCLSEGGEVVVVGDVKQSIYRWRGGDVDLLVKEIEQSVYPFPVQKKFLATNYRSLPEVISSNNQLFEKGLSVLEREGYGAVRQYYESYHQEAFQATDGGLVCYMAIPDDYNDQKFRENSLQLLLSTIRELENDGKTYSEITVLVRYNRESAIVAEFLKEQDIPVLSSEALYIQHSGEVQFIVAMLKGLTRKRDVLSQYTALQYLELPAHNLRDNDFVSFFPKEQQSALSELSGKDTYTAIEQLIRLFSLQAKGTAYLIELLDLAVEFSTSHSSSIAAFLQYWDDNIAEGKRSVSIPEGQNAVNIVSIHKSKGLEYPIVIIPFANWSMSPHRREIFWFSNNTDEDATALYFPVSNTTKLEESTFQSQYTQQLLLTKLDELNALYVAVTRAVEELHVFFEWSSKAPTEVKNVSSLLRMTWQEELKETSAGGLLQRVTGKRMQSGVTIEKVKAEVPRELHVHAAQVAVNLIPTEKEEDVRTEGRLLHAFFEHAEREEEVVRVQEQFVLQGLALEEVISEMAEKVIDIYRMEPFADWLMSWEQLSEREVFVPDEDRVYRPDRLFVKGDRVIVVDFKIRHNPDSESRYRRQLLSYKRALMQLGYNHIDTYIVYVENQKLHEVA